MLEPKYDEDTVNLGYLKKVISDTEENIDDTYKNVSRHYASRPKPPYYQGDTWIDGDIVYTCINTRTIGLYQDSDWVTESGAKTEAERKNKTYLTQPSNYNPGDMWVLQSDEDHRAGKKGEILISTAGRKEYDSDDWVNMLGYGPIKSINEVAGNLNNAINRIGNVEEAIQDGLIITFYQDTVPEGKHLGDLWYVTGEVAGYIKGKIYRYDGTNWIILNDPSIQEAFDEANEARLVADGKIQSFYSEAEPTQNMGVGDLWIDLSNNNQLYRYNGTNWVAVYDTRINELVTTVETVTERVTTVETDLGEIDLKVKETTTKITTIEGDIDNVETLANNAQSTADSAVEEVNNITNTQGEAEGKSIHIEDSAEEPFVNVELYGESIQEGTPTPDSPSEIENIEGNIEFKVEGKNRFDKSIYTSSAYNGYFLKNILKVGQNYTISFKNIENKTYGFLIKSMAGAAMISDMFEKYSKTAVTFNYTQAMYDKGYTLFIISMSNYQPLSIDEINNMDIQLEEGSIATDYEPYKSQVAYFPLSEGQKLMEGSYTGEDGIHNARKQVVFDGSSDEDWHIWALNATNVERFYINLTHSTNSPANTLCSHFNFQNNNLDEEHFRWSSSSLGYNQFVIYINKTRLSDVTVAGIKGYLQANPITVEYELAEEEITPYTNEQRTALEDFARLTTYKNITNITSTAYAKIVYMRDNGLDVYETKQNASKKYTETSEKLAEQKMTVDGVITQVSDITSKTDELTGEVKTINSAISTVKQTVEGWSADLKNTGGNNIFYYSLDFWDNSNGLEEYSDTEIMQNSISQTGYALNNGSAKQTQSVKNGFYTCSFNYKKLLELAVCQVKINSITYDLTETDWAEFEQAFEVKTNKIEIEFISDTDNSLYISDLMINVGKTKLSWSQNANETRTDTVTIGKGIQVNSSAKNTYHRIDADGNRTFNKATGKVVNEATDKGTETEELVVRGQAKVSGLLMQKVSDQVWINSLL